MAQERLHKLYAVTINGEAISGVANIATAIQGTRVPTRPDGAFGAEFVPIVGRTLNVNISHQDVDTFEALMIATPGTIIGHLTLTSDVTALGKYTIGGTGAYIIANVGLRFPYEVPCEMTMGGAFQFGSGQSIDDMVVLDETVAAAGVPVTQAARYFRVNTVQFDPTGAGAIYTVNHVREISINITAVVIEDLSDAAAGPEAMNVIAWNPPEVSMVFADGSEELASARDMAQKLIGDGEGVLTAVLTGMGVADKTLTINNLRFDGGAKTFDQNYAAYTASGICPWRDDANAVSYEWEADAPIVALITIV